MTTIGLVEDDTALRVLHRRNVRSSQTPRRRSVMLVAGIVRPTKTYFVYIMTNRSKTLYVGITNSLIRRVREHKLGIGSGFTAKYRLDRLVYFERFEDVHRAIGREKTIKGWLRIRKIALIVSVNPAWRDLSAEWYERHQFQPENGDTNRRVTNSPLSP
jgi:putative endonuclease